jgi:hypothetical protein
MLILPGGWPIGSLVAAVQRHKVTSIDMIFIDYGYAYILLIVTYAQA